MILIILLAISILLQLFAAGVAIRLTRVTKFNSSWVLITLALIFMCFIRFEEFMRTLNTRQGHEYVSIPEDVTAWVGVATSLCFAVGVVMIRKVLQYMSLVEEQKRNNEKRTLSAVIRAEEQQRQQFSKELHDGLGPLLSAVKMSVSALAKREHDDHSRKIIANTDQAISLAIKSIREISNNLSPNILNSFGVSRALSNFINRLRLITITQILYETNMRSERFSADLEVIVYRVVCELLNNALKHADASRAAVIMTLNRDTLTILCEDDGRGFDTNAATEGMGLSNINSRISSVKGDINIESAPGEGTKVSIRLKLK